MEELGIRIRADGVVEAANGVNLTGTAIEGLGKKADAAAPAVERVGNTAKQTAQALRLLPAQITDVVVSLAGGQPAYMVAIQQGGQIKDMFGGIVPAAKAVAAYIPPVAWALLGVAGAAGVLATAYASGASEASGYRRELILTGNAAGTTRDRVSDMAAALGSSVGTQRQAAEALTALLKTSQVGANGLQLYAETAVRMQRMTGQSIETTAKHFEDLGKNPLKASIALNESYNYLTRSTYDRIKALEKEHRLTEAATVAQNAYATAMTGRLKEVEGGLGYLESKWKDVHQWAGKAWSAMLGVGRDDTLMEKLKTAEIALMNLDAPGRRSQDPTRDGQSRTALIENIERLKEQIKTTTSAAAAQGEETRRTRDYIHAQQDKTKVQDAGKAAYASLMGDINRHGQLAQAELDGEEKLTDAQRWRIETLQRITAQEKDLGAVRAKEARARVEQVAQLMEEVDTQRKVDADAIDNAKKETAEREKAGKAAESEVEHLQKARDTLEDHTLKLTMDSEALHLREMILGSQAIAQKANYLATIEGLDGYEREANAVRQQIALLQQMQGLKLTKHSAEVADAEKKANADRTKDLEASIRDGLFQGFKHGQTFGQIFVKEFQKQLFEAHLKMPVQVLAQSGSDLIGQLLRLIPAATGNLDVAEPPGGDIQDPWNNGGARAWGGSVEPNTRYQVAENGMEVLVMGGQRGTVVPNHDLAGVFGAGGPTIHYAPSIHVDSRADRADVQRDVQRLLIQSQADLLEKIERRQV